MPSFQPYFEPVDSPQPPRGRHRKPRRRAIIAGTSAVAVVAAVLTGASALQSKASCDSQTIRVAAAPEIASAVGSLASTLDAKCRHFQVSASAAGKAPADADVWIAESSASTTGSHPSIAASPVVIAVPKAVARKLGPAPTYDRLPADVHLTGNPIDSSAVTQAAVADLGSALSTSPATRGVLTSLLRSLGQPGGNARLTTEAGAPASAVLVRPASGGTVMDYPYVVLHPSAAASQLQATLTSAVGRDALSQAGFGIPADADTLTAQAARQATETVSVLARPTRALALVDVSGSMATVVPGANGATRMDLARSAIRAGLGLLPEGTVAGLWKFSDNLTPSTDYAQIAPLTELTPATRGLIGAALDGLQVDPDGGTGLYSSTLAAVRQVRTGYDASRVNSVIVLTDGKDQDATAHTVPLAQLLKQLRAEAGSTTPVEVIGIAYGPDSDTTALRAITKASGGVLYTARDPRDLPVIFREAIGNRLCSGNAC